MRHLPRRGRATLAVTGVCLLAVLHPLGAAADDDVVFTISDSRITESSGLATDPGQGVYWTAADSAGDGVTDGVFLPAQPQGESITVALDSKHLLVGSEGKDALVLEVKIADTMDNVPSDKTSRPAQTPAPAVTSTSTKGTAGPGSADKSESGTGSETEGQSRAGTLMVLAMAALVALAAGGAAYWIHHPSQRNWLGHRPRK